MEVLKLEFPQGVSAREPGIQPFQAVWESGSGTVVFQVTIFQGRKLQSEQEEKIPTGLFIIVVFLKMFCGDEKGFCFHVTRLSV